MIVCLRHGQTAGNLEKRYIGSTDEPLCNEGIKRLEALRAPQVEKIYVSPMLRCWQTAQIVYPGVPEEIVPDFRECDFGRFEGENYQTLSGDPDYQRWIDSNGTLPFPGGESRASFEKRCQEAFLSLSLSPKVNVGIIAHGGTLMSILSAFAIPRRSYFDWQTPNGSGYLCEIVADNALRIVSQIGMDIGGGT